LGIEPHDLERGLPRKPPMRGRITEAELPLAEESFPGICQVYDELPDKPATFLQLLWIYEDLCECADALAAAPLVHARAS